jgi:diguanylate cyclase (GGDEF)-like protein/PAS domain S-box-containing protein
MHELPVSVPRVAGAYVALHGVLFAAHWAWPIALLAVLVPSSRNVGLADPLLFIAVGVCFWSATQRGSARASALARRARIGCAILLVVAAVWLLGGAGLPFGLDAVIRSTGRPTSSPIPLSPNSGLAFLLTGCAFLLLARPLEHWRKMAFVACALAVTAIGLAGVAGYLLGPEALYRLPTFNRILLPTALAFAVVGAGLWGLHESAQEVPLHQIEGRIARRALGVIALVALGGGVAGFALMRESFEGSISKNLQLTATTTATSLAHTIDAGLLFPKSISSRPALAEALERLADRPSDAAARAFVQRVANNIVGAPLTAAEFHTASDVLLARAGTSLRDQLAVAHPLAGAGQSATLGWNQGYILLARHDIHRDGRLVGRVLTEQRLPLFDQLLAEVRAANESSDAAVCSIAQTRAVCAPTRFRREAFSIPLHDDTGQPASPIVRALLGQTGVQAANDQRGVDVVSAHVPIAAFGLGLAVGTDVSTLYAPLRPRLALLALSVAGIIALGIYGVRSQVRPVVGRLAESERSLKAMIEEQAELVSLAKPSGELTYTNPAYARHFGLRPEQMLGHNLFDHVEPADLEGVRHVIASVLASGQTATHENRTARADHGVSRWIAWTNSRQLSAHGEPMLHSVGRDITERKQAEERVAASERFMRGIADNVPALVAHIDSEQRYTFANAQFALRLGMDPATMIGRTVRELRPEFYDHVLGSHLRAALRGEPRTFDGAAEIDGRTLHYRISYVPDVGPDGQTRGCYSLTVDITAVREAEQAAQQARLAADQVAEDLRSARQRLNDAIEALPAGFELYDADDRLIMSNSTAKALFPRIADLVDQRLTFAQLVRANWERGGFTLPDGEIERWIAERLKQRRGEVSSRTQQLAGGRWFRTFERRTHEGGVVGVRIDITELMERDRELARLNEELQRMADTDPLTLTANRRLFDRRVAEVFAAARAQGTPMAIVVIDIDYFKRFNDHHGHPAGDSCLRRVAAVLTAALRGPQDLAARLGGEEFAVLLHGADADGASATIRRCMDLLHDAAIAHGDSPLGERVTFSAGVAILRPGESPEQLLARADAALYEAKLAGRARWHLAA